ncbi:MAG: response regulator transcription factor [Acidimicrobiia bacterium]|nr:response regulator transcription factor [Acidimicrobiia bacterium]
MTAQQPRVTLVEDHPLVRYALGAALTAAGVQVTEAAVDMTGRELVAQLLEARPTTAVVDLGLPIDDGGLGLIPPLVAHRLPVLVLTGEADRGLWADCVHAGAEAVLSKTEDLDQVVAAIVDVCEGRPVRAAEQAALGAEGRRRALERRRRLAPFHDLSRREQAVLASLMAGVGPAQIAERDIVSIQTVRTQIKILLRKLGVRSQLEAAAKANEAGWHPEPTRPGA